MLLRIIFFSPFFRSSMFCAITTATVAVVASALVALSVQFFSIVVKILQKPECVSRINNLKKQHKKHIRNSITGYCTNKNLHFYFSFFSLILSLSLSLVELDDEKLRYTLPNQRELTTYT